MPVLLDAVLAGLNIRPAGNFIDATFGRGGHSREILRRLGLDGRLLAIDRDPQAINEASGDIADYQNFELIHSDFAQINDIALERRLAGHIDGILFDLGVSSPQLDDAERGFSFQSDGPLDMRMDPGHGQSAAEWLADVREQELKRVLRVYGEEQSAGRIARAIVIARSAGPIATTGQLAALVAAAAPGPRGRIHPATRTFQAIRLFLNDELGQLDAALKACVELLAAGGRLCVISFHSLEDRIVKRFMRDASRVDATYRGLPDIPAEHRPRLKVVGKPQSPSDDEIASNPRSRSARLRIAERLA